MMAPNVRLSDFRGHYGLPVLFWGPQPENRPASPFNYRGKTEGHALVRNLGVAILQVLSLEMIDHFRYHGSNLHKQRLKFCDWIEITISVDNRRLDSPLQPIGAPNNSSEAMDAIQTDQMACHVGKPRR
jgi:hypothetical protein